MGSLFHKTRKAAMELFWKIFIVFLIVEGLVFLFFYLRYRAHQKRNYGWVSLRYNNEMHIIPDGDIHQHVAVHCPCHPTRYSNDLNEDPAAWMVVHVAQDGRKQR